MAGNRNMHMMAMLMLILAAVMSWHQLTEASKIAYKKPLYGKTSYIKDKRFKLRTTSSPTTTEADWPVPVEFIIQSMAKTTTETAPVGSTITTEASESLETAGSGSSSNSDDSTTESSFANSTSSSLSSSESSMDSTLPTPPTPAAGAAVVGAVGAAGAPAASNQPVPCTCGVFLSSQIKNGLPETPLIHNEMDRMYPCNAIGRKQCQTKCLEAIVQHLPNSASIVCATLGHNCHKERAYLFIKNCHNQWVNTNLQAGREYCCKEGVPYRCPLLG